MKELSFDIDEQMILMDVITTKIESIYINRWDCAYAEKFELLKEKIINNIKS